MDDTLSVIEAFADGELVAPSQLNAALAVAEGREHLIEILVLRGLVADPGSARSVALGGDRPSRSRVSWSRWAPAAAVVALIGGITGYVAGARSAPLVAREPAAVASSAPAPTVVIQLRPGIDWTEKAGGR